MASGALGSSFEVLVGSGQRSWRNLGALTTKKIATGPRGRVGRLPSALPEPASGVDYGNALEFTVYGGFFSPVVRRRPRAAEESRSEAILSPRLH
jgi:hypothetical protein